MSDPTDDFADGVGAVVARAVQLYAIGQHQRGILHLQAVMVGSREARLAATGLATMVAEDTTPAVGWEITGLPLVRYRRAMPVANHLVALSRGRNYGAILQLWDQITPPMAADLIAMLLAMAGAAACHPEWN